MSYYVEPGTKKIIEWSDPENLDGTISDLDQIMGFNKFAKRVMADKDSGRPGHYYGRDVVIEGSVPAAAFFIAPLEFGGDEDWYKDDRKFQAYMQRHPGYDWLKDN